MKNKSRLSNIKKYAGIGMVELLVALALSAIVSIVVIQLFIQNKTSYVAHENVTRLQENGRYAIQLLTNAVRSADFWGCIPSFQGNPSPNIEDVANNVVGLPAMTSGIFGQEGGSGNTAGYPSLPDTLSISGIQGGRSFQLNRATITAEDDLEISILDAANTGIDENGIVVISDCTRADIFQATNDVDSTITGPSGDQIATIEHAATAAPATPPSLYNNSSTALTYTYGTLATVYTNVATNTSYTIAPDDPDGAGGDDPIPSLVRTVGGTTTAIVPGVENLQVVYGQDTDGDNEADRYVDASVIGATAAAWEGVVSVRISILVRSPEARNSTGIGYAMDGVVVENDDVPDENGTVNGPGRYHNRRVYTTTVSLRNRTS